MAIEDANQKLRQTTQQVTDLLEEQDSRKLELKSRDKEIKELELRNSHLHEAIKAAEARTGELQVCLAIPLLIGH